MVEARFRCHPHHVLGTVRSDGWPRLSGVNVGFREGEMWIGSMPGSLKSADLTRDGRTVIHSAPLSESLDGGDVRVEGLARRLDGDAAEGWIPDGMNGDVFVIDVNRVHMVEVDGRELRITVWEPGRGLRIVRRQ